MTAMEQPPRMPQTEGVAEARRPGRPPQLDARLRAAADWVTDSEICADIGCDHGRLGAVLLSENRCRQLLAADVSAKALAKARRRIGALGYGPRTVFTVADGLSALQALPGGHADTVCILGMGGDTVACILRRGQQQLAGATLILGAQTEFSLTRLAVQQIGYQLTDERVVCAGGRLYLLLRAMPAACPVMYTERELLLGPCLLAGQPPLWRVWLARKQRLLSAAVAAMHQAAAPREAERLALAERELRYTEEALLALEPAPEGKPQQIREGEAGR